MLAEQIAIAEITALEGKLSKAGEVKRRMMSVLLTKGIIMMNSKKLLQQTFSLLLTALLLTGCNGTPARIDQFMQNHYPDFSGAILVAQKGNVLINQGYGLADRENDVPNTPQTRFAIGSITKSFTAVAIMILQERGELTVQDPVCDYISDCPAAWKTITLHHLLTHTSGIHNYTDLYGKLKDNVNICQEYKPEEVIAFFKDLPLDFTPGSKFSYSNSGYFLLGVVIEKVSGDSYETFIQKNIFQPLGMTESGYDRSITIVKHRASGYSNQYVNANCWDVSLKYAAGGLYSTTGDLYKWDQALYTNQLVSKDTLDTIFTSYSSTDDSNAVGYGYGWLISQQSGHRVFEHSGSVNGFDTQLARYPDDQVTIIILSNMNGSEPTTISRGLAALVFGEK